MDLELDQPISALASPAGRSARGIVRISGADVRRVVMDWFTPDAPAEWRSAKSARSHSGRLRLTDHDKTVSVPLQVLYWPDRRSYTGQPLIELHLPGSPALLEAVLSETFRHGARSARPGEFTLRAFLAGKLDLLQAEAVLGVIDAHDHRELQQALSQLAGGVSQHLTGLRRDLLELLADLEAGLDFVDEDIEFISRDEVVRRLQQAFNVVVTLYQQTQDRMQSRVRPKVVLAGLPNAGKSTLFNRLAGAEAALVSDERGTTRDFLTRCIHWPDFSFDLIDTAGWESEVTGIAAAAQSQRHDQFEQADLLLWCSATDSSPDERVTDQRLFAAVASQKPNCVRVWTKIDLETGIPGDCLTTDNANFKAISISAISNRGLSQLEQLLRDHFAAEKSPGSQWLGVTAARCRETLESVIASLERATSAAMSNEIGDELIAVDLHAALEQLGIILGVIYTDDILDRIFSKFCIGK